MLTAMFQGSYRIARVFGVPIQLDLSLIVLAVYFVLTSESVTIGSQTVGGAVVGLVTACLLVLSVVLHELGHTYASLKFGCRVRDITLMLIGGRATLLDMPREPWKEFVVAISGPLISAALWLGGMQAAHHLRPSMPVMAELFKGLAWINLWLLIFNLLPAFPMDGGRLLRAALAQKLGRLRATYIASRVGRVFAVLFAIWGFFPFNFFLLLIALFVYRAAGAEYRMVQMESGAGGPFFRGGPPPDDQAYISPPPYRRGRDVSDVYRERDGS
ncbi:MAG: site-2 protease family protein [Kiritimatiellae bacterium]|nr:site-2 protease family protein [Kiritimatiellia bacterium]